MATAPRVSENPVVQQHYVAQLGLTQALADVADSLGPDYRRLLVALTREFQSAAIALSADYYTNLRDAAQVPGSFTQPVTDPWPEARLTDYMDASVADMIAEADMRAQAVAVGQRLTIDAGVGQLFGAMDADPKRPRWARVTRPGACSFCLMLATRGAVYRSEGSADFRAHSKMHGRGGVCQCGVEVSFTKYEPPAHIRSAQSLYVNTVEDSMSPVEKRNAFRRAVEAGRSTPA